VLRCVRRCQRGECVFPPLDRFLWHAREPFDNAQLTALCRNAVDNDAVLAALKAAGDLPTQRRARAGSVSSHLSTVFRRTASKPATPTPSSSRRRRHCRGRLAKSVPRHVAVVDKPQEPGPQPSRLDARASATQRHRRDRAEAFAAIVELAREKTPPPPPPPLKQ
jgi:hypothetical protein